MSKISGYKLISKIGEGGMATVYKGMQVSLNRPVAIKVLSKQMVAHSEILERFKRESLIIARINHPNIIAKNINPKVGITISGWDTKVREATTANTAMTKARANQRKREKMIFVLTPRVFSEISPNDVPLF